MKACSMEDAKQLLPRLLSPRSPIGKPSEGSMASYPAASLMSFVSLMSLMSLMSLLADVMLGSPFQKRSHARSHAP